MQSLKVSLVAQPYALARCSDSGGKRSRSRKTKEERKAMVEVFVKKHQASNNGNFPSLNLTHKEVGGSFYTVREIVREIIQENRVLGPATPISENENVGNDPESPVSLSRTCGTAINLSQEDITFLSDEEDSASEISLGRDHKIVEQQFVGAHTNDSDNHIVSEPEVCVKGTNVNHWIRQPVNGLATLVKNNKVVEESTIALPDAADLTSNITVEVWDPISDAKEIECSNEKSTETQGLAGAAKTKEANAFDANIEDLTAFNGKATISLRDPDTVTLGFHSTETSQVVESKGPSVSGDQDWQATDPRITAAPNEPQLENTVVDTASTTSDSFSSVSKVGDQVRVKANKTLYRQREESSLLDEKSSGCSEKSSKFPEAKVANPLWKVINSLITSFVKFWVE
ncbi:uncharacterized protein [Aristolochia californica]|uniref:uncharacterized protein n=1 Tax=Aristolochia californica TaxID=171875 RepID=UPI0035DD20C7